MRKIYLISCLLAFVSLGATAQVTFQTELKESKGNDAEIVFTGKIEQGWHVYSTNLGGGGPIEATFNIDQKDGVEPVGKLLAYGKEVSSFDRLFGMEVRYFENNVRFVQKIRFTKPVYTLKGYLEYGACNDQVCLPPTAVEVAYQGKSPLATSSQGETTAASTPESVSTAPSDEVETEVPSTALDDEKSSPMGEMGEEVSLSAPVIEELKAYDATASAQDMSWLYIFLQGLLWGFIALLTPCVWPIIPMTVSYFLHRNHDHRSKAIREAMTYGLSIIVIYVGLGLLVTLLWGPSTLNALSTNAYFNIFLFLLLVVLAASFLGAFELTLPSKWTNKIDAKSSSTTGLLSIFLMAFTLALVSFSCTGPIIGFLLVGIADSNNLIAPTIGMFGFALALAIPFTLFAVFPTWLKQMPKSGGWMNVVKVTLAFIELAFALKFLSVADLAYGWHILDRETFIALWIAIFGLLAMYLLGRLKFKHDEDDVKIGVPRFFLGLVTLAFTIYMLPGLWGAPLKAISAFTPPMYTQDFYLSQQLSSGSPEGEKRSLPSGRMEGASALHSFKDYDEGMAYARQMGKPVMIDFTGFGCVNCRKMEAAVWTDPRVASLLNNDYVLISLYVDDKTPLPEHIKVSVNGKERTLRTVGDRWSHLQQVKFGANAQPFYVLLDNEGKPLNRSYGYDEDVQKYVDFLQTGLNNYQKRKH